MKTKDNQISRRGFLRGIAGLALVTPLTGCIPEPNIPEQTLSPRQIAVQKLEKALGQERLESQNKIYNSKLTDKDLNTHANIYQGNYDQEQMLTEIFGEANEDSINELSKELPNYSPEEFLKDPQIKTCEKDAPWKLVPNQLNPNDKIAIIYFQMNGGYWDFSPVNCFR